MYAQQSSIDPSLAALLQTAQMVTPDQTPTVAAQVAQAAQQKMQPQGIMQGMPQARQDYANAAPSMMRNMQQQQMQQMVRQAMQPQHAGIEGLPAPNMQGMAEGGVVGYSGEGSSFVNLSDAEIERLPPDKRMQAYKERLSRPSTQTPTPRSGLGIASSVARKLGPLALLAELFGTSDADIATLEKAEQERRAMPVEVDSRPRGQENYEPAPQLTVGNAPPMAPEAQRLMDRQRVPAPRPPAPAPAPRPPAPPAEPQSGIAQLVAPTPESAMASARSTLGLGDTSSLRAKEAAYLEALKAQPAKGQQGLAALQAQQSDLQRMYDKAEKESNINSVIQQLLGRGEGPGGAARASMAFSEREDARRRTYGELQVANATKRDAIIDLQNAREAGNAKAALEAEGRIRAADLAIAKAEGDWAGHIATSQANVYGTQVRSENEAANREANRKLEEYRRQTQLMKPKEQDNVARLESMKLAELTGGKPESATPTQKLQALDFAIKTARGTGVDDKAEFAALRQQATMLRDELKLAMESDPSGKSPRIADLRARLDGIYKQLGGESTAPTQLPPAALSQLKEGVVTKFANGQQWTLKNGQPTQVK